MSLTFILGNGFDLNIGLPTSFRDYLKVYREDSCGESEMLKRFKTKILNDSAWEDWVDFEEGIGKQSKKFDDRNMEQQAKHFVDCLEDFYMHFMKYLIALSKRVNISRDMNAELKKFVKSINLFYTQVSDAKIARTLKNIINGHEVNFLQLNYTDIFDRLVDESDLDGELQQGNDGIRRIGESIHVHGHVKKSYPVMGVGNPSQISNESIRNDPDVKRMFIKQNLLNVLKESNLPPGIEMDKALNIIDKSTVFCIFGSSIGSTDIMWWERIGSWLKDDPKNEKYVIIFGKSYSAQQNKTPLQLIKTNDLMDEEIRSTTARFIASAGLPPDFATYNPQKIIVELMHRMFNFKLNVAPLSIADLEPNQTYLDDPDMHSNGAEEGE
ncbi:MAG: bacteriophage abortive infection AbiH family protein [Defluviitaleaceae bacterium]|nr:bacteriophage abortive infection AbiH family protein [Defluviitaleaceae bacterium]